MAVDEGCASCLPGIQYGDGRFVDLVAVFDETHDFDSECIFAGGRCGVFREEFVSMAQRFLALRGVRFFRLWRVGVDFLQDGLLVLLEPANLCFESDYFVVDWPQR
ncbi:hypothetical protein A6A22_20255 [Arthrobacter sp. OY3WO11]|nr:hypothetical protein A6A22_20255 [Arthrobacter sp. OY3WO11]